VNFREGVGISGVAKLLFFVDRGDAVNKILLCGVAVFPNPALLGAMKLFAMLGFLVCSFSNLNLI